ncbi:hypothetical protein CVS29_17815 [Arthrobacter psychrochitiniphilus]|uniref:Uncharacterized protein n=1 Tax=Arthrobacter psychrochitiniphilus TaxID=291045 RepID=A0A2V3DNY7_9MICC|nr:hypothetical protein CVS29_17815 [Arthrobacter psychrochitiniphilus]
MKQQYQLFLVTQNNSLVARMITTDMCLPSMDTHVVDQPLYGHAPSAPHSSDIKFSSTGSLRSYRGIKVLGTLILVLGVSAEHGLQ